MWIYDDQHPGDPENSMKLLQNPLVGLEALPLNVCTFVCLLSPPMAFEQGVFQTPTTA
jgi:hypothetical protein